MPLCPSALQTGMALDLQTLGKKQYGAQLALQLETHDSHDSIKLFLQNLLRI